MAGYTRQSTFADGDTITAALFNNEYNQLLNAFGNTSGHKHDGTANEGPVIGLIGDAGETSPNNKVLIDTTNNYIEFYVQVSNSPVQQLYIADGAIVPVTDSDVDLGTTGLRFKDAYIDTVTTTGNVAVGGNLTVTGTTTFNGGTITMGDAATDNVVFGADVDSNIIPDDDDSYDLGSSTQEWRDLYIDGTAHIDTLDVDVNATIAGTLGVTGVLTGTSLDISGDIDVDGTLETDALSINGTVVTSTAAELNLLDGKAFLDEDNMASNSATGIASQQSIKAYVDTTVAATNEVVEDTTPQLGGDLDLNSNDITGTGNIGVIGTVTVDGDVSFRRATNTDQFISFGSTIAGTTITQNSADSSNKGLIIDASVNSTGGGYLKLRTEEADRLLIAANGDISFYEDTGSTAQMTWDASADALTFTDNTKAIFGAGSDLQISHTGSQSLIDDTGTGQLAIRTNGTDIRLISSSNERMLLARPDAGVELYYDSSQKLATTATGIDVTGTVTATGTSVFASLDISGDIDVDGTTNLDVVDIDGAVDMASTLNVTGAITGTLATAAQPNITSLGTLTALTGGTGDLNWDSGTLFVDSSANSVGIGTVSPSAKFHVKKDGTGQIIALFSSDLGTNDRNMQILSPASDSASAPFEFSTSNSFQFTIDGGNALNIASDKNIGIGTTSPNISGFSKALTIDSSESGIELASSGTVHALIASNSQGANIQGIGSSGIRLFTSASGSTTERMRIDTSGNVLVGTTNTAPATNNVEGIVLRNEGHINVSRASGIVGYFNRKTDDGTILSFNKDGTGIGGIGVANTNNLFIGGTATDHAGIQFGTNTLIPETAGTQSNGLVDLGQSGGKFKDLYLSGTANVGANITLGANDSYVGFPSNGIYYNNTADHISVKTAATERMRINSAGNVGIGTTSPAYPLDIAGERARIAGGTTTTFAGLEVENSNGHGVIFGMGGSGRSDVVDNRGFISAQSAASGLALGTEGEDPVIFYTNGTSSERMRIDSSGKVGIGTDSPAQKLHVYAASGNVVGQIQSGSSGVAGLTLQTSAGASTIYAGVGSAQGLMFYANGTSEAARIDSSGNVGIGTSSPSAKLDVYQGELKVTGTLGNWSVDSQGVIMDFTRASTSYIRASNASGQLQFQTGGSNNRMIIDSSGNVGIGTASPNRPLEIKASSAAMRLQQTGGAYAEITSSDFGILYLNADAGNTASSTSMRFLVDNSEAVRILDDGTMCINATSSGSLDTKLYVEQNQAVANKGPAIFSNTSTGTAHRVVTVNTGGNSKLIVFDKAFSSKGSISTNGSSVAYNTTSDYRLKENISYTFDATTRLKQLKPARFNFIEDETNTLVDGFIAHEVSGVVPEAVTGEKDAVDGSGNATYQEMDASKLVPLLVKTIQELEERITALES